MGRNWIFAEQKGREMRLDAEANAFKDSAPVAVIPPFFSHDATLQSYFNKGWKSVSLCEIRLHLGLTHIDEEQDLLSKIRRFRECLSQSLR
ncbi:hypothetical protein RV032_002117 [Vibrio cholerae]|nr:hypothetical protein [Vibrio cholerae]ELC9567490.1 hypothetical protein [Vibrio cholerae]ELK8282278.1 hypothetical protein [Vibrio cholerae]